MFGFIFGSKVKKDSVIDDCFYQNKKMIEKSKIRIYPTKIAGVYELRRPVDVSHNE